MEQLKTGVRFLLCAHVQADSDSDSEMSRSEAGRKHYLHEASW